MNAFAAELSRTVYPCEYEGFYFRTGVEGEMKHRHLESERIGSDRNVCRAEVYCVDHNRSASQVRIEANDSSPCIVREIHHIILDDQRVDDRAAQ